MSNLKATIIRILNDEELSGYSIYRMLLMKGIKSWPNHVYTLLADMEKKDGLLQSRWLRERKSTKKGAPLPRKHLYTLSEMGKEEYENIVKDSLSVLMERFYGENLSLDDLPFHIGLVNEFIGNTARWSRGERFKLVIASPSYHPLVCFPKFYYSISGAYPNSSIYVIKSPWNNTLRPLEGAPNLIFLDGSRNEIPLKDNFADYVLLQGFPDSLPVSSTINESMRVLKDDGCLFVEIPAIMSVEMRISHNTVFPDYVLRLFYELCGQDRIVRLEDVKRILSNNFDQVKYLERRGRVIFFGFGKKKLQAVQQDSRRLTRAGRPITA